MKIKSMMAILFLLVSCGNSGGDSKSGNTEADSKTQEEEEKVPPVDGRIESGDAKSCNLEASQLKWNYQVLQTKKSGFDITKIAIDSRNNVTFAAVYFERSTSSNFRTSTASLFRISDNKQEMLGEVETNFYSSNISLDMTDAGQVFFTYNFDYDLHLGSYATGDTSIQKKRIESIPSGATMHLDQSAKPMFLYSEEKKGISFSTLMGDGSTPTSSVRASGKAIKIGLDAEGQETALLIDGEELLFAKFVNGAWAFNSIQGNIKPKDLAASRIKNAKAIIPYFNEIDGKNYLVSGYDSSWDVKEMTGSRMNFRQQRGLAFDLDKDQNLFAISRDYPCGGFYLQNTSSSSKPSLAGVDPAKQVINLDAVIDENNRLHVVYATYGESIAESIIVYASVDLN